jgi:hypothetical protein
MAWGAFLWRDKAFARISESRDIRATVRKCSRASQIVGGRAAQKPPEKPGEQLEPALLCGQVPGA